MLADPDTTAAELDSGQPPLGVTHVNGNYTLSAATASPADNQFGLLYIRGNLTVNGFHTFKGLVYVEGSITISAGVGTGRTTLLYSREAALAGIAHARPWRVLSWVDAAALQ